MMDSNKSRSLLISFVLALAIIFGGIATGSRLNEPELTSRMILQEDGSYQREFDLPNPRYITGTTRTIYTFVDACIPSSQGYNIARSEGEFNLLAFICQLGVTVLFTGAVNRIFSNIISNALKYSDGDFGAKMDRDGSVIFTNTAHNLNAVTVGRLFDRFYTVEASCNSSGLGLSIAKLLIERMGGSISAHYQNERLYMQLIFCDWIK